MVLIKVEQENVKILVEVLFNEVVSMLSAQEPDQVEWLVLLEELMRRDMNRFSECLPVTKMGSYELEILIDMVFTVELLLESKYQEHCDAEEDLFRIKYILEILQGLCSYL